MSTAKVRIHKPTPGEQPADNDVPAPRFGITPTTIDVTDARGRKIKIQKLSALDRMQLALIVGAEASENRSFMLYANLATSVFKIDDDHAQVASMRSLQSLVAQLDEDGLDAIMRGWIEAGWIDVAQSGEDGAPPVKPGGAHEDAVKN